MFVEAMACGSRVVTSNLGPMNEFVKHQHSGLLVDNYEDPAALARSIALAATDENVRATLARNAPGAAAAFSKASVDRWEVQLNRLVLARL